MTSYEAIFKRRSVRHYRMERLPQDTFKNFRKFEQGLMPLDKSIEYSIEIIDAVDEDGGVKGMFSVRAPYYLVILSEDSPEAKANAGYLAEQLVLYLTAHGIGTCYQGSARPYGMSDSDGLSPAITVAFGYASGTLYRESFKADRLKLSELAVFREDATEETTQMIQAARMAPSAMNGQPWRFVVYQNRIHIFIRKRAGRDRGGFTEFDMGVMLCHIMLAADEGWRDLEFVRSENIAAREFKNNRYFMSVLLV